MLLLTGHQAMHCIFSGKTLFNTLQYSISSATLVCFSIDNLLLKSMETTYQK